MILYRLGGSEYADRLDGKGAMREGAAGTR